VFRLLPDKLLTMARIYEFEDLRVEHRLHNCHIFVDGIPTECEHKSLIMDENGQVITCAECKVQVSTWWALLEVLARYKESHRIVAKLTERLKPRPALVDPLSPESQPAQPEPLHSQAHE
jgi:hypothetical protein